MFSQIKDIKHIEQIFFILLPGSCPGVGLGVVKNFSVGICDGAPLTECSSLIMDSLCGSQLIWVYIGFQKSVE